MPAVLPGAPEAASSCERKPPGGIVWLRNTTRRARRRIAALVGYVLVTIANASTPACAPHLVDCGAMPRMPSVAFALSIGVYGATTLTLLLRWGQRRWVARSAA